MIVRPTLIGHSQCHHCIQVHIKIILIHNFHYLHYLVVLNKVKRSFAEFDKFNVILDSKAGIDFWLMGKRSFLHLKLVHLRFKSLSNKLI